MYLVLSEMTPTIVPWLTILYWAMLTEASALSFTQIPQCDGTQSRTISLIFSESSIKYFISFKCSFSNGFAILIKTMNLR